MTENEKHDESMDEPTEVSTDAAASEEPAGHEEESESLDDDLFLSPDDDEDDDEEVIVVGEEDSDADDDDDEDDDDDALSEANEALKSELEAARTQLGEVSEERDELKNKLMRSVADLENYRRRADREKDDLRKYGIDKVVSDLIPAVDNLERALQHAEGKEDPSSIVDGVTMVYKQIVNALAKYGVQGFVSKGEAFDPQRHEAIQQVETTEYDTGTVVEEYQKGYFLHDRLLRPALVAVAKRIDAPQTEDSSDEEQADVAGEPQGDADDGAAAQD
ncbi:nucleotide exchange factor GrpE [Lujinxingia vulgaris]|uniref:Protein GrpE n=1 Tax=Lujinxingia vulgaris TaxID=2600176 RepID=A0A5C6XDL4_9DELT|nr:nucleotide exchange factor GrpE [Lujinxingia vulgaris]TXD39471.1 nucleotide exchange factor GrpE [Lujinxingia vulgaris]